MAKAHAWECDTACRRQTIVDSPPWRIERLSSCATTAHEWVPTLRNQSCSMRCALRSESHRSHRTMNVPLANFPRGSAAKPRVSNRVRRGQEYEWRGGIWTGCANHPATATRRGIASAKGNDERDGFGRGREATEPGRRVRRCYLFTFDRKSKAPGCARREQQNPLLFNGLRRRKTEPLT